MDAFIYNKQYLHFLYNVILSKKICLKNLLKNWENPKLFLFRAAPYVFANCVSYNGLHTKNVFFMVLLTEVTMSYMIK